MSNVFDKFIGKVVATRGIGSGVNVGRCVAIDNQNILLEEGSYFVRSWTYTDSHGAFHSLSRADITGGEISAVKNDTIITDLAQAVICDESILEVLKVHAK